MKCFYKIKNKKALSRINKACQRQGLKYFTIRAYGCWFAATNKEPEMFKWDDIVKFKIEEI